MAVGGGRGRVFESFFLSFGADGAPFTDFLTDFVDLDTGAFFFAAIGDFTNFFADFFDFDERFTFLFLAQHEKNPFFFSFSIGDLRRGLRGFDGDFVLEATASVDLVDLVDLVDFGVFGDAVFFLASAVVMFA